jgi:hypothetical protein
MRVKGEICQVAKICQVGCQTVGTQFFFVLPKIDGCQVDLANSWLNIL